MQPMHPLHSLPTVFPAPLQHLQQLCLSTASPPAKPRVHHLPALSLPNHSLSPPPQNHEVGGGGGGGTEALPQRPEARGQESGASDHLTGLQPRRDAVWGVEWGEGRGGVGPRGSAQRHVAAPGPEPRLCEALLASSCFKYASRFVRDLLGNKV